jgi:hypothetical protein
MEAINPIQVTSFVSETRETFTCDRCGISFNSESQMNAHNASDYAVAGGELTTR